MSNTKAVIITIGDELLIGQVIDTNSAWIAQQLNTIGIDVVRRVAVADTGDAIRKALDEESQNASLILLTGGLGPTADDVTKPLLCDYFGGKMIVDENVLAHVTNIFVSRNRPILEVNLKQAEVPNVCEVLFNRVGTAPGMWFEKEGKIFISMPGVPFEMKSIMEHEALPRIKERFTSSAIVHKTIVTVGEGESFIAERIKDLETALPSWIKLAYLPSPGLVRLRLTGRGDDLMRMTEQLDELKDRFAARLENIVVAKEDISIEKSVAGALKDKKLKIGLAESCTGGYIAHRLTEAPGASEFFMGSIVCYHVSVKENILGVSANTIKEFDVVSKEVAIEMAIGARDKLSADIGFGITGLLSESKGHSRKDPGTVWMAVASKDRVVAKEFRFFHDRTRNIEMAGTNGMAMIWKFTQGKI